MGSFPLVSLPFIFNLESHSKLCFSLLVSFWLWLVSHRKREAFLSATFLVCTKTVICVFGLKESLFMIWEKCRRERKLDI